MKNLIPDLPFIQRAEDVNQPPVIHALREIGDYFGIAKSRFRLPEGTAPRYGKSLRDFSHTADANSPRSQASAITETREILRAIGSRDLHAREISLVPGWHRMDIGPLLVFRDGMPFAILPAAPDRYEYLDHEKGQRFPVTDALTSLVRGLTVMRLKNHIRVSAESALWVKLLSLPAAFFRKYQIGDLALRMQGVAALSEQLSSSVAGGIFILIFDKNFK